MNNLTKTVTGILLLILISIFVEGAVPSGCTLTGNHYECNLTTQTDDSEFPFDAGSTGIQINYIDVTGTGGATTASCTSACDGENMEFKFISTDKIIVLGDISLVGGTGGQCDKGVGFCACQGGDTYINLSAPIIEIENISSFSVTGGATGSCHNDFTGERGGNGKIFLDGNVTIIDSYLIVNPGTAGSYTPGPGDVWYTFYGNITINRTTLDNGVASGAFRDGQQGSHTYYIFTGGEYNFYDTYFNIQSGSGSGGFDNAPGGNIILAFSGNTLYTDNFSIEGDGGNGASANGAGGSITTTFNYSSISDWKNSDIDMLGGTGASRSGGVGPGRGGIITLTTVGQHNITNTNYSLLGGTTGACGAGTTVGPTTTINWYGNQTMDNVYYYFRGGSTCGAVTDAIINDNSETTTISNSEFLVPLYDMFYYLQNTTLAIYRNTIFNSTGTTGKMYLNGTRIDFYNNTIIDLDASTSIFQIKSDSSLFWNFTIEDSSTMDSDFFNWSVAQTKLAFRGNNDFGTAWVWNTGADPSVNETFDQYLHTLTDLDIVKVSSDASTYLFNYTNFTCQISADYSSENEGSIVADIKFKKDGVTQFTQNDFYFLSGVPFNSSIQINGTNTDISDKWSCEVNFSTVPAGLCYQETANVSTDCGGLSTGSYTTIGGGSWASNFRINYSKPSFSLNNSLWLVKHSNITENVSISSNCWDQNTLQFNIHSIMNTEGGGETRTYLQCYNGTAWEKIGSEISDTGCSGTGSVVGEAILRDGDWGTAGRGAFNAAWRSGSGCPASGVGQVFEEAMNWNMSAPEASFTEINTTNNVSIINAYPFNIIATVGILSSFTYSDLYNFSAIQTFTIGGINDWIQNHCTTDTCTVPINFISSIDSILNVSNLNISYGVASPATDQNTVVVPFEVISGASGIVNITNIKIKYFNKNTNITIIAKQKTNSSVNVTRNIEVVYSNYSLNIIPSGIDYWDIGPNLYSYTQTEVTPFGNYNGNGNPFWNITALGPKEMDVYLRWNETIDSCITIYYTSNTSATINTTPQFIFNNYTNGITTNISTFANLSCAWNDNMTLAYFRFIGICSECVLTYDWEDMNEVIQ